jgi:antitoxin PrlF
MAANDFSGSITTSGSSDAIRLDKRLFRTHPEFRQKAKVRANVIGPGTVLISVVDDGATAQEPETDDPILDAFLAFLARSMQDQPELIEPLSEEVVVTARRLTKGIVVDDDASLPDEVTF